jgi:hypothetical protein
VGQGELVGAAVTAPRTARSARGSRATRAARACPPGSCRSTSLACPGRAGAQAARWRRGSAPIRLGTSRPAWLSARRRRRCPPTASGAWPPASSPCSCSPGPRCWRGSAAARPRSIVAEICRRHDATMLLRHAGTIVAAAGVLHLAAWATAMGQTDSVPLLGWGPWTACATAGALAFLVAANRLRRGTVLSSTGARRRVATARVAIASGRSR